MATSDNILEHTIGNGMLFPIKLTKNNDGKIGWYPTKGDPNLIINNLNHLLTYVIGQKMRQKEYEDRIIFKSATVTRNANKLHIEMQYTLVNSPVINTLGINYNT